MVDVQISHDQRLEAISRVERQPMAIELDYVYFPAVNLLGWGLRHERRLVPLLSEY